MQQILFYGKMYDLISKHKEYIIGDKRIIWFWDEDNHSVKELKVNNLCIYDSNYKELWNMRQILICDDSCVGVRLLENNLMYFGTFYGLGFTINLEDYSVAKKVITK